MPGLSVLLPLDGAQELSLGPDWLGRQMIREPGDRWVRVPTPGGELGVAVERPTLPEEVWFSAEQELSVSTAIVGEIYDGPDDPAAALLDSYVRGGHPDVGKLDGSFSAVVCDRRRGLTFVATDTTASRPIFFGRSANWICVAPESSIVADFGRLVGGAAPRIRPDAVVSFLLHGHLLDRQTWFEDVYMLPPASVLSVRRDGAMVESTYHRLGPRAVDDRRKSPEPVLKGELASRLRRAVAKRLGDERSHVVLPLSGGVDSRAILGCLLELEPRNLQTVTWGVRLDAAGSDAAVARDLAEKLGVTHHFLERRSAQLPQDLDEMTALIDGSTDDPAMHHHELSLMRRIRDEFSGRRLFRGDECFGFGGIASSDDEAFARVGLTHLDRRPDVAALIPASALEERVAESRQLLEKLAEECPLSDPTDRKDYYYATQRLVHYLNRSSYYKLSVLCLENPWLDREVLDFVWSVETRWRVDKRLFSRTLDYMFPELMDEPVATSNSLEDWNRTLTNDAGLSEFVRRRLIDQADVLSPHLDPAAVARRVSAELDPGATGRGMCLRSVARGAARSFLPDGLYARLKQRFIEQALRHPLPPGTLVMRLLVLQAWLSKVQSASTSSVLMETR